METKTAKENLREKFHSYFTYLDGELETQWRGSSHPAQVFDFFWKEIEKEIPLSYYQVCPKCGGEGVVQNLGLTTTAPLMRTCPVCDGNKTLFVDISKTELINKGIDICLDKVLAISIQGWVRPPFMEVFEKIHKQLKQLKISAIP